MKVVIVAGGLATRLRPVTEEIPKCMIDVGGKPLIEHQIEIFKSQGFTEFIFCIAHLREKVKEYFWDGSKFGVKISYSEEKEELMGTAGAVKLAESNLSERFLVFFGDIIANLDFKRMVEFHNKNDSLMTIAAHPRPKTHKFTSFLDVDGDAITKFVEKPEQDLIDSYPKEEIFVNSSVYVIEPEVLEFIPENIKYDFGHELIPNLLKKNKKLVLYSHDNDCYKEIGTLEKYSNIQSSLKKFDINDLIKPQT